MANQAHKYREYAEYVGGGAVTRLQASEAFGVAKSTATYHLERAVMEGLLVRFHAYADGNQTGWGYMSAERPKLPFEDAQDDFWPDEPDIEHEIEKSLEARAGW